MGLTVHRMVLNLRRAAPFRHVKSTTFFPCWILFSGGCMCLIQFSNGKCSAHTNGILDTSARKSLSEYHSDAFMKYLSRVSEAVLRSQ